MNRPSLTLSTVRITCTHCGAKWSPSAGETHWNDGVCPHLGDSIEFDPPPHDPPRLIQEGWLCTRCNVMVAPYYRRCEWCVPPEVAA